MQAAQCGVPGIRVVVLGQGSHRASLIECPTLFIVHVLHETGDQTPIITGHPRRLLNAHGEFLHCLEKHRQPRRLPLLKVQVQGGDHSPGGFVVQMIELRRVDRQPAMDRFGQFVASLDRGQLLKLHARLPGKP